LFGANPENQFAQLINNIPSQYSFKHWIRNNEITSYRYRYLGLTLLGWIPGSIHAVWAIVKQDEGLNKQDLNKQDLKKSV
jgi:hypothetical protein